MSREGKRRNKTKIDAEEKENEEEEAIHNGEGDEQRGEEEE